MANGIPVADKIKAFSEFQRRNLAVAKRLAEIFSSSCDEDEDPLGHSGFSVLFLTTYYFEMIWQLKSGIDSHRGSNSSVESGFTDVFPAKRHLAREVQKLLRNGIYHSGAPKESFHISREVKEAICEDGRQIIVNPLMFVNSIATHLENYIAELVDGKGHANFEKRIDEWFESNRGPTNVFTTPNPPPRE